MALLLAISLLIVSVPMVVARVGGDGGPALTLDICHAPGSAACSSIQSSLPLRPIRVGPRGTEFAALHYVEVGSALGVPGDPPATPPPKS
jgi:hypothetical protein